MKNFNDDSCLEKQWQEACIPRLSSEKFHWSAIQLSDSSVTFAHFFLLITSAHIEVGAPLFISVLPFQPFGWQCSIHFLPFQ